jgi:heat shock protein HslJ
MTIAPRAIAALYVALCVAGCQSAPGSAVKQQGVAQPAEVVVTGNWSLVDLDGIAVRPGSVTLSLQSDGRFIANVYCNYARGFYIVRGRSISFNGWDATERGCNDETDRVDRIGAALRGDGYTFVLDSNGDLLLTGPAQLRLRRS